MTTRKLATRRGIAAGVLVVVGTLTWKGLKWLSRRTGEESNKGVACGLTTEYNESRCNNVVDSDV